MQNNHIMALALALCNAGTNSRVTIPRLTGKELKLLLEWLSVLRATLSIKYKRHIRAYAALSSFKATTLQPNNKNAYNALWIASWCMISE